MKSEGGKPGLVFGVVGLPGTGKSEAIRLLSDALHVAPVYFGGVVIKEVQARGLQVNESSEAKVRMELRREHGMAAMAILSQASIEESLSASGIALIDGIYSMAEYKFLKSTYPGLLTLAMHASKDVRYARLAKRPIRPLKPIEVDARDMREVEELDKAGPIALADYHYVNDEDIDALQTFVRKILSADCFRGLGNRFAS